MSGGSAIGASRPVTEPLYSGYRPACAVARIRGADLHDLDPAQWDALSANAIEPNPFFGRGVVRAGLDAFRDDEGMEALAFRMRQDGRLVGLFPFRRDRLSRLLPLRSARAALNIYQVGGAPLIDRSHADAVAESFLELAHADPDLPARWSFPHVELEGHFARLMTAQAGRRGFAVVRSPTYSRPVLTRVQEGFAAHVEQVIGKKRAKDIQRNLRRLDELGAVRFERATDPQLVGERLEQFLTMERAGWKGRRGTAMLCKPDHARFARLAFSGKSVTMDSVLLDEVPIAVCVNLAAGRTIFAPKCSFNEDYRKYGAGLVLEYLVIEQFYADERIAEMNASTTTDGHIISGFWNEVRAMGTLIVGPDGIRTRLLGRIEDAGHGARGFAKRLINRFR